MVAGFATLIIAFGAVAGWSLQRQQRTVRSLRLANEVYLQLTAKLGDERGNQVQLVTVLDRPIAAPRDRVVRFDEDLTVDVATATTLVARADGERAALPVFDWAPFGVTNPLFVDVP